MHLVSTFYSEKGLSGVKGALGQVLGQRCQHSFKPVMWEYNSQLQAGTVKGGF